MSFVAARSCRAPFVGSIALVVLTALTVALTLLPAHPAQADPNSPEAVEQRLAELINAARSSNGVAPLRVDVRLVESARSWSQQMAADGRLAHDGNLDAVVPAAASRWAENVARTSGSSDAAAAIHDFFMASPAHRANVLDAAFTDLGVGVAHGGGAVWATERYTAGAPAPVIEEPPAAPAEPAEPAEPAAPAPAADAVQVTAATASTLFGGGRAEHAVLVRDDAFPDALAAGPLAGRRGPLLFNPVGDTLHPGVRAALDQTLPSGRTVYLVGGTSAVSFGVEQELAAAGWRVSRIAGDDRVRTALAVAYEVSRRDGSSGTALLATAADWPDAAAGSAFAAAGGHPVLLVYRSEMPASVAEFLEGQDRVYALGGRAVISDYLVERTGAERIGGFSREATAAEIAEKLWGVSSGEQAPRWWIVPAVGDDAWAWALGAGPLAAAQSAPVLLAGDPVGEPLITYLDGLGYGGGVEAAAHVHGPVADASVAEVTDRLR